MHTRTKIICTLGPAVDTEEKILELIDAGMNVARLNFSHGTQAGHAKVIERVKKARAKRGVPLAIMLDTKGPEIRVGKVKGDHLAVDAGMKIKLVKDEVEGDAKHLSITPPIVIDSLSVGATVLFDDGYISSRVVAKVKGGVEIEILNSGILKTHKGVNVPGVQIDLPAMTEQDRLDIAFGCKQDVDLIAASFIRSAEHVLEIKRLLVECGRPEILVIAKIENSLGVQNFDSIVQVADGIMVARGDLGVELPLERVPYLQKMMIRKCYQASKPVVTATQMLESMIKNPRPTRAEVSDVANAIYDSTSAVMLSGETAMGAYPIEALKMMRQIVREAEKDFDYREFFLKDSKIDFNDVSSSVALATVKTAYSTKAQAIFVFTSSGSTARLVSRFRPQMPIIALASNPKIYNQLAFNWGVIPVDPAPAKNSGQAFKIVSCFAMQKKIVRYGDLVVVTAGSPFGVSGTTNMMIVESIGDVLVRGSHRPGRRVEGKVVLIHSLEEARHKDLKGKIVATPRCDEAYVPFLKHAIGIILQNHPEDLSSERQADLVAKKGDIPLLIRADGALSLLTEGQLVTLDPSKGVVYRGSIGDDADMLPTICLY